MDIQPDKPISTWGLNPVENRQPDEFDDAIQIVETNADLLEAKAVIRQLVAACKSGLLVENGTPKLRKDEIRAELWTAINRANSLNKTEEEIGRVN
jgi:hypothetical protein